MVKITPFDAAEHLNDPQVIKHYLAEARKTGDERVIRRAKQNVRRAKLSAERSIDGVRKERARVGSMKFAVRRQSSGEVIYARKAKAAPAVKRRSNKAAKKR